LNAKYSKSSSDEDESKSSAIKHFDDSIFDVLDKMKEKKAQEKRNLKRVNDMRRAAARNVKISTPANRGGYRQNLVFDISPIQTNAHESGSRLTMSAEESTVHKQDASLSYDKRKDTKDENSKRKRSERVQKQNMEREKRTVNRRTPLLMVMSTAACTNEADTAKNLSAVEKSLHVPSVVDSDKSEMPIESIEASVESVHSLHVPSLEASAVDSDTSVAKDSSVRSVDSLQVPSLEASSMVVDNSFVPELNPSVVSDPKLANEEILVNIDDDQSNHKSKGVKFVEPEVTAQADVSKVKLKPGKWRKSLAAWRKSHKIQRPNNDETSRKLSTLFPIKTDPGIIKRYTMRLQHNLEKCKFISRSSSVFTILSYALATFGENSNHSAVWHIQLCNGRHTTTYVTFV
jgi:hypothetical protein